ncbi:MAG: dihydroxyacetone kinase subunit L [Spirochaetaceae bacterium]|jgi:dihydroxyacetone kinase-like protein|nr:dihydroxyacetone kinase subunit L [Spirochaetaceae bacterium]
MSVTTEKAAAIIGRIAVVIEENKQYLSDLDQQIGDGDHGFNMARGFEAVMAKLSAQASTEMGELLKTTAMALISNVGGASGPLYGTLVLKMAGAVGSAAEFNLAIFTQAFKAGVLGVQERGKAVLGEKTMLDVLIPVLELFEKEAAAGTDAKTAFADAAALAEKCVLETKDKIATKGRAAYLGERSKGHVDPGAASACLIIQTIAREL